MIDYFYKVTDKYSIKHQEVLFFSLHILAYFIIFVVVVSPMSYFGGEEHYIAISFLFATIILLFVGVLIGGGAL